MPQYHHAMEQYATQGPTQFDYPSTIPSGDVLQRLGFDTHLISTAVLQQQLQYLYYSEPLELSYPLDLSVKNQQQIPITPPCTPSPSQKRESPQLVKSFPEQPSKKVKSITPASSKKSKATRRLNFLDDSRSPVSGTIIRELRPDETLVIKKGDIDPAFNVVEVTEDAKAELAKIENHIGDYICRLCSELYEDAFGLAQHRCSRIIHIEYRCPECDKVFNCPANLASHRRWHKPKLPKDAITHIPLVPSSKRILIEDISGDDNSEEFSCTDCGRKFKRLAYLKKHQCAHQIE